MIGIIGISHHTASLEERELFALDASQAKALVEQWRTQDLIVGAIILSTCNRTEIYYETASACPSQGARIIDALTAQYDEGDALKQAFVHHTGSEATRHLFRLASGLESMVVGETQILGQLKAAFRMAIDEGQSTPLLSRLFHKAFEAAKHIRTHHLISATPISAGSAAVDFVSERLGGLASSPVLIIGAGQMAETIYDRLQELGTPEVHLYNRTGERAERFAEGRSLRIWSGDDLRPALQAASVVFVATSASSAVVTEELLSGLEQQWSFFDLGVPRNVAQDLGHDPRIHLYTIDDLGRGACEEGRFDLKGVEVQIEEMVREFARWCDASEMREVIRIIQQASDAVLEQELSKLPSQLSAHELELITQYDTHLRITFATAIVSALREVTQEGRQAKEAQAIHQLFAHVLDRYSPSSSST